MDQSDDDMIWTDASEQISSGNSDTTTPTKMNETVEDSDLERKCKNELQQELFNEHKSDNDYELNSKKKKKNKEKLNLKIKSEPESDLESVKKKKKSKRKSSINESNDEKSYTTPADDSYIELRIKEEAAVSPTDSGRKHKKNKKVRHESLSQNDDTYSENTFENNSDVKKKSKKKKHKYEEEQNESVVKELFSAEETIVGTLEIEDDTRQKKKKKKKNKKRDSSPTITQNGFHANHEDSIVNEMIVDESHNEVQKRNRANTATISSDNPRQSRISDRILFEDDSQTETIQVNRKTSPHSFKLQQFLKSQGNLEHIDISYSDDVSISPDDEIFLLNCPTEVEVTYLEDLTLLLDSTCRLKLGGQKYESNMESDSGNNVTLLLFEDQKHKIKSFPCQGTFNLRKRLPKAHFVMDNIIENEQTNFIPLPDTKCRHPLFGPDYKKAIKLPTAIKERLQNDAALDATPKKRNKKKKHKTEKEDHIEDEERKDVESTVRRKRRRSSRGDDPPSSKRARPTPAWDNEQAIEHNLFDF